MILDKGAGHLVVVGGDESGIGGIGQQVCEGVNS
jgi:hypothetical protein